MQEGLLSSRCTELPWVLLGFVQDISFITFKLSYLRHCIVCT